MTRGTRPNKAELYDKALELFYNGYSWNNIFKILGTSYQTLRDIGLFEITKVQNGNKIRQTLLLGCCSSEEIKEAMVNYFALENKPNWFDYCAEVLKGLKK